MQTAGFVLVGGLSRRMGRNKALLPVDSKPLVEHVAACVSAAAGNVALVGRPEEYRHLGFECLADLRPGLGPLAGIETALASCRGEFNLIVACDMPEIKIAQLSALLAHAQATHSQCMMTRDASGSIQPLCGVYRNTSLGSIGRALDAGRLRLLDLIHELNALIFEMNGRLTNINTPQDWAAWQEGRSA